MIIIKETEFFEEKLNVINKVLQIIKETKGNKVNLRSSNRKKVFIQFCKQRNFSVIDLQKNYIYITEKEERRIRDFLISYKLEVENKVSKINKRKMDFAFKQKDKLLSQINNYNIDSDARFVYIYKWVKRLGSTLNQDNIEEILMILVTLPVILEHIDSEKCCYTSLIYRKCNIPRNDKTKFRMIYKRNFGNLTLLNTYPGTIQLTKTALFSVLDETKISDHIAGIMKKKIMNLEKGLRLQIIEGYSHIFPTKGIKSVYDNLPSSLIKDCEKKFKSEIVEKPELQEIWRNRSEIYESLLSLLNRANFRKLVGALFNHKVWHYFKDYFDDSLNIGEITYYRKILEQSRNDIAHNKRNYIYSLSKILESLFVFRSFSDKNMN